jgi:hypothetical protein
MYVKEFSYRPVNCFGLCCRIVAISARGEKNRCYENIRGVLQLNKYT